MSLPNGWKRMAAGIYVDAEGAMHILDAELLAAQGYADTPANRRVIRDAAAKVFAGRGAVVEEGPAIGPDFKLDRRPACPGCQEELVGAFDLEQGAGPYAGKPLCCSNCGELSVFTEHGFLRRATDEDRAGWSPSLRRQLERFSAHFAKRRS